MNWWDVLWILFIVMPLILFWMFALADLFRRDDLSGISKVIWLFAIVFLPLLGTTLYVLLRPHDLEASVRDRRAFDETTMRWDEATMPNSATSRAEQLSILARLHDSGQLSESEYSSEKSRILAT